MRKRIVVIAASTVLAFSVAGCGFGHTKESAASVGGPATESASEPVTETEQETTEEPSAEPMSEPVTEGGQETTAESIQESVTEIGQETAQELSAVPESEQEPELSTESGRQDGERFEAKIMLEGMEEAVRYEHVRNEALGFEMDYDYELLERRSEADTEGFYNVYDDPAAPEDYLLIRYDERDAETVAEAIGTELSEDYDIYRDTYTLECAGSCIRIDASAEKGGKSMPEHLQKAYIIPAGSGCIVAREYCYITDAEGFGRRIDYMMNTLSVIRID